MTKVKSEMLPMLALLESGEFRPGALRPLHGVGSNEPSKKNIRLDAEIGIASIRFFFLQTIPLGLFFSYSFFRLFAFSPMDAGDTMQRILGLLVGSPDDEKQQLLKNAMDLSQSDSNVASTPSLSVAGDYLQIFSTFIAFGFLSALRAPAPSAD